LAGHAYKFVTGKRERKRPLRRPGGRKYDVKVLR
jgi:hypothetical protein